MCKITHIQNCKCGAVTVSYNNGASNSMFQETFNKLHLDISDAKFLPDSCCCDHCVNHWGIDLCECGSGERVGECDCGSEDPHDFLGVKFDSWAKVMENFGKYY